MKKCFILLGMMSLIFAFGGCKKKEDQRPAINATLQAMSKIDAAIEIYKVERLTRKAPESLETLTQPQVEGDVPLLKAHYLFDAWGNPFEYRSNGENYINGKNYTIRSAGPDGKMHTNDDLINN